jgi:hypothetical protein
VGEKEGGGMEREEKRRDGKWKERRWAIYTVTCSQTQANKKEERERARENINGMFKTFTVSY